MSELSISDGLKKMKKARIESLAQEHLNSIMTGYNLAVDDLFRFLDKTGHIKFIPVGQRLKEKFLRSENNEHTRT